MDYVQLIGFLGSRSFTSRIQRFYFPHLSTGRLFENIDRLERRLAKCDPSGVAATVAT